ncbi:protease inhibitor I42 family protein [Dactylosporangium sp. CS-047395]|uniref:protease inhibitor I42 family protein n=1 Tax=Dactylosporangium sp. CS-047395 TaxID=3239936 RepID=UPI003D8CA82A
MADVAVAIGPGSTAETVSIAQGDRVVVRVGETPTTGYRWQFDLPGDLLSVDADEYRPGGAAPGAAGERVVALHATRPGHGTLTLRLARAWEGEPARTVRLAVTVRGD